MVVPNLRGTAQKFRRPISVGTHGTHLQKEKKRLLMNATQLVVRLTTLCTENAEIKIDGAKRTLL